MRYWIQRKPKQHHNEIWISRNVAINFAVQYFLKPSLISKWIAGLLVCVKYFPLSYLSLHSFIYSFVCQCQCQCQSWIYIAHKRKASNALTALLLRLLLTCSFFYLFVSVFVYLLTDDVTSRLRDVTAHLSLYVTCCLLTSSHIVVVFPSLVAVVVVADAIIAQMTVSPHDVEWLSVIALPCRNPSAAHYDCLSAP